MTSRKISGKGLKIEVMANCRITPTVAYNPWTEEELHFPNKKELALHFGINPKTVTAWFKFGKPVIDLMENERGIIDIAKATQAPLNGFEIYTQEEWQE